MDSYAQRYQISGPPAAIQYLKTYHFYPKGNTWRSTGLYDDPLADPLANQDGVVHMSDPNHIAFSAFVPAESVEEDAAQMARHLPANTTLTVLGFDADNYDDPGQSLTLEGSTGILLARDNQFPAPIIAKTYFPQLFEELSLQVRERNAIKHANEMAGNLARDGLIPRIDSISDDGFDWFVEPAPSIKSKAQQIKAYTRIARLREYDPDSYRVLGERAKLALDTALAAAALAPRQPRYYSNSADMFKFVAALALILALAGTAAAAMPPSNLTCPPPTSYPKGMLDNLWSATAGYYGSTNVTGYVLVNTGRYNFVQASNFTGIFVQYYSRALGTYVAEYYIDLGAGTAVMVLNITFTLLAHEKNVNYNEFCLNYNPASAVTEYQQGSQMSDRFFYGTYYEKYSARNPNNYGTITRSEFFNFDATERFSSNCLTTFAGHVVTGMSCFEYVKVSNIPSIKSAPGPHGAFGSLEDKQDTHAFLKNYREVRHISEFKETFDAGKFRLPISMLYDVSLKPYVNVAVVA